MSPTRSSSPPSSSSNNTVLVPTLLYDPTTIFSNPSLVKGPILVHLAEHYTNTDIATRLSSNLTGANVSVAVVTKRLTKALRDRAAEAGETKTYEQLRAELNWVRLAKGGAKRVRSARQGTGGVGMRKVLEVQRGAVRAGSGGVANEVVHGLPATGGQGVMQYWQGDFARDLRALDAKWKDDLAGLKAALGLMTS